MLYTILGQVSSDKTAEMSDKCAEMFLWEVIFTWESDLGRKEDLGPRKN